MTLNVLVTGACGFLGRHVARICASNGHTVHGIGHGSWKRSDWKKWGLSTWRSADITIESLKSFGGEPDLIIHCAGSGSVAFSLSKPSQDFDRTVVATRDVLEYVRLHRPVTRVVFPSSASVYGNATLMPIPVTAPLHPISPYGVHKQIAEELCLSYSRQFGISVAIVRLFSIYGIGLRKQLLWDACRKLSSGDATFGGIGSETRDWLHVEDAAKLLHAAGLNNSSGHLLVNGATGVGVPTRHIVNTIAVAFEAVDRVSFTGKCRPGDPVHLVADMAGVDKLGWEPTHNLDVQLKRYISWFKTVKP